MEKEMSNKKIPGYVARSQQEQALAAKIDESAARTGKDFSVTNAPNFAGSSRRVVYW